MIHSAIHAARPDVNCAAHSHSVYGRAFSTLGRELEPLTQDACAFYNVSFICSGLWRVGILSDTERLILLRITSCIAPTEESYWRSKRVRILPDCLETKRSIWFFYSSSSSYLKLASFTGCHSTGLPISHPLPLPLTLDVQNHGLLVATNTIESTVHFYIALEKSCQVQLMAEAAATSKGSHPIKVEHDDAIHTWKTVGSPMAGWFSGLPQFQSLERREGVRFAFSKNVQLPAISARL